MRERYLTVPINETGISEYNHGIEHTNNMLEFVLSEKEFFELAESGVFRYINDLCGLMIDDYESEIISSTNLEKCGARILSQENVFSKAVRLAIYYKTFLALDF